MLIIDSLWRELPGPDPRDSDGQADTYKGKQDIQPDAKLAGNDTNSNNRSPSDKPYSKADDSRKPQPRELLSDLQLQPQCGTRTGKGNDDPTDNLKGKPQEASKGDPDDCSYCASERQIKHSPPAPKHEP